MIILASTSPTRQAMLRNAGLGFGSDAPLVDEKALVAAHPQWLPEEIPLKLAEAKAMDVSARHPMALVVGADQVLALESKIFGKPRNREHCREQLLELRGKTHLLISSVVLARNGISVWSFTDRAELSMRRFTEHFLESYLDAIGNDCTSSVGGYKIEGRGIQLFDSVRGDHFTILGLPLVPLLEALRAQGEVSA